MSPTPPGDSEREAGRLADIHSGYSADPRRKRRWSAANPGNIHMREQLARAVLDGVPGLRGGSKLLLDVGCGGGWWLERLIGEGLAGERLVGVDLLGERVSAAAARLEGVRIERADARRLPLADGSVQLLSMFTVLSLMSTADDVARALKEARRVCSGGGTVAVWEPRVPTPNRATRLVRLGEIQDGLAAELSVRSITVLPALARHAPRALGLLERMPWLRTHRLVLAHIG